MIFFFFLVDIVSISSLSLFIGYIKRIVFLFDLIFIVFLMMGNFLLVSLVFV